MATFMAGKQLYQDFAADAAGHELADAQAQGRGSARAPPVSVCIGLSLVATMVAQLVAYPMYTVKSCLQSGYPYKGASSLQCTRAILAERGGFLGMFPRLSCLQHDLNIPVVLCPSKSTW